MNDNNCIEQSVIRDGAKEFEFFYLRPKKMANKEVIIRMRINRKWNGWKLKDGLVESLGLEIGDTVNTEVTVLEGPGLIDEADDVDLFASGEGADWLLENGATEGMTIDAKVKFVYSQAPVGGREGRDVWKLSLVFIEGYQIIQDEKNKSTPYVSRRAFEELREMLGD